MSTTLSLNIYFLHFDFIDAIALVPAHQLPSLLSYDNFASMHFANSDYHRNSAGESGKGNGVGVVRSEGRNDDLIGANVKNAEHAVNCIGDLCFEVNFDEN